MRTTRKTLDALLVILAKQLGVESGRYERGDDGKYRPVPGLMIERYSPGDLTRYRVTELLRGTGERDVTPLMPIANLERWIRGAIWALDVTTRDHARMSCQKVDA